ncbi:MaoC family dehydratase N-terminal domain-containing protein [Parasphingopyxis marina]|uniref:MaoC family dehydratase N-terminal domain-containing protein n=1 Tax=Parasphingopyxis marina TaxID=2761622 RepID=A0A842I2G9_9SPHN|nr:MaoC family dehydratase N-terminal domain-containing protein [Parasphingopyxis marina]MBC2778933.1 MaoC family dehydratase N-terminal domain-containing protein [Parasphingopyxis marina]
MSEADRLDSYIGHRFVPVTAMVEAGRLRFFHKAIGETNPALTKPDEQGRLPIPPTYLFCLEMLDAENPFAFTEELGVPIETILHAEQSFTYRHPVKSGDRLDFLARLENVAHKKGGALTFLTQRVDVTNQNGVEVAEIERTLVIRNGA